MNSAILNRAILAFMITFIVLFFIVAFWILFRGGYPNQQDIDDVRSQAIEGNFGIDFNTPANVKLGVTEDDPQIGPVDAPITIVEFSDFECPFCRQAHPILRTILNKYQGQIHFVYRDFPVSDAHPNAQRAAEASECAQDQGKFWELHDAMFENQESLSSFAIDQLASQVGINMQLFGLCLQSEKYAEEVFDDLIEGSQHGVQGTPSFIINGRLIPGVISLQDWEGIIQSILTGDDN